MLTDNNHFFDTEIPKWQQFQSTEKIIYWLVKNINSKEFDWAQL
jgi:hypothetical protein